MATMAAKLTPGHLEQIADFLTVKFPVLKQRNISKVSSRDIEIDIRERIVRVEERGVRVEEELKNQREIIRDMMVSMDKRFAETRADINGRFEDIDKRFTMMMWFSGIGFTLVTAILTSVMVHFK